MTKPWLPWLVIAIVQAIVLFDVVFHDPLIGYDANHHRDYVEALAAGHLPEPEETGEYFVPPLPYVVPAIALASGLVDHHGAAKVGQLQNWPISLGILLGVLAIARHVRPGAPRFAALALGLLGTMPVYYKTLSFLRGEPHLTMLGVWAVYLGLRTLDGRAPQRRHVVLLGLVLGAAILSRQWAFFFFPALGLYALVTSRLERTALRRQVITLAVATAVAAGVGAWFYIHLKVDHGSFTAYNRSDVRGFHLDNQPRHFYLGLGDGKLFTDPVRRSFANQLLPILYSEFWGDYWCYFHVYGRHRENGRYILGYALDKRLHWREPPAWLETNRQAMGAALGRVNAVSIVPSALLTAGLVLGLVCLGRVTLGGTRASGANALFFLVIAITAAGYFWFLVSFPDWRKGGTIKASYLMQAFPFLALLGADVACRVAGARPVLARVLGAALVVVAIHNLPFLFTRFVPW